MLTCKNHQKHPFSPKHASLPKPSYNFCNPVKHVQDLHLPPVNKKMNDLNKENGSTLFKLINSQT